MESLLVWGLALVCATVVLIVIEVFVPSGGLLATLAALCGISGVVCLMLHDWRIGVGAGLGLLILAPLAMLFAFHVMPSTPLGRRLIQGGPSKGNSGTEDGPPAPLGASANEPYAHLVGKEGEVATDLRPIGSVRVEGQRIEAMSDVAYIQSGVRVKIIKAEGTRLRVRRV